MRRLAPAGVHALCVIVIALASVYLYSDLLQSRAFLSHEVYYTYIRAHEVALELSAGRMPQAFPDAIFGAGFAFPRFYPPFSLWLSAAMSLLIGNTCLGVNLAFFLSVMLSGVTMYFAGVVLTRDRLVALAASLLYISMPYRFVDVYVRGALAEAWSFVWYPIVIVGLWRAYSRRTLPWYLPVSVGLLLVTHNITALYFLAFCVILCMLGFVARGPRGIALPVLGLTLGCGLAVWFAVPQQHYMKGVLVSDASYMWADDLHVQEHRVMPWQFFYSLPTEWYGESSDPSYTDAMSFELGAGQLLVIPVAVAFAVAIRRRWKLAFRPVTAIGAAGLICYVGAILFMMWPIVFLTTLPRQFSFIQFPWRMLAIAAFLAMLSLLACVRVARLTRRSRWMLAIASVVIVLCVPAFERRAQTDEGITDATITSQRYLRGEGIKGYTVLMEYVPREFDRKGYAEGTLDPDAFVRPHFADRTAGEVVTWSRSGLDIDVEVNASRSAAVVMPLVFYDFYEATTSSGERLSVRSERGFLTVEVPNGTTKFAIRQILTPVSRGSIAISAMTGLVTALCAFWFHRPVRWTKPGGARRVTTHVSESTSNT